MTDWLGLCLANWPVRGERRRDLEFRVRRVLPRGPPPTTIVWSSAPAIHRAHLPPDSAQERAPLREDGRRLTLAETISAPDDVVWLASDELDLAVKALDAEVEPIDEREVVAGRAERTDDG